MQTCGCFSGGEQTRERALSGLGVDADATHHIVARWTNFHGPFGDVHVREVEEWMVHGGQFALYVFGGVVRGIQVSATMLGAASFPPLRVNHAGHHVPRGQFHPMCCVTSPYPL